MESKTSLETNEESHELDKIIEDAQKFLQLILTKHSAHRYETKINYALKALWLNLHQRFLFPCLVANHAFEACYSFQLLRGCAL
jgi:folate-binding Fe-S cluster repair protein YgfZ